MSSVRPFVASDHEWLDVTYGGVVPIEARLSPTEAVEAAPSDDADEAVDTMCEAAFSEGFEEGERKGAEEARRAYSEGYYNGRASVEETNACMQAHCNARIAESAGLQCAHDAAGGEGERRARGGELRKLETAKEMVEALAKTRQRFVDQVVATSEENHRLHKEADAEASELRAQLRAKMAEVCELRDKVGAPEKDVRQLTHELQTARGTLEARENMLAQVKEELATERLTSAELVRQRDEVLKRIANVIETATRQPVRAEEVEKERDALKDEAEGRSGERTVQHAKLREEIEVLQAQLKEKTEQWERQKANFATYRKAQAEFHDAHAKERRQLESERNSLKETAEIVYEQCRSLQSDNENRDAAIAVLRKKVAEVEGEARALSIERDAAVTQREGTHTALKLANEHCIRYEAEIAALKEDQERLEDAKCKLKASGEQFDRLREEIEALQAQLKEKTEQVERQKETIIGLRKQVADALNARQYEAMLTTLKKTVEALTLERNEAVENEKCAKERLEDAEARACELEKQIGPLKEDQEVVKRKYAASREQFDRLQTDYYAEQAKVAQLCEQLRVAVRDHEATKSHHKSLIADTSDAANELGKVRRELAETKKALADMKGYKQDEYVAAQELQRQLEDQEWKCHNYVAERDAARRDLSTAKAELARCQALANGNHEKWQWAKEDGQRVCQLAREHFIKLEAVEVENESLKRMLSEEGGEKHRLQLEREREEYEAAMKLPTTAERNAAVAKCFNSGVLPGASPEEVLASERMTASIVAAKAALNEEVILANGLSW